MHTVAFLRAPLAAALAFLVGGSQILASQEPPSGGAHASRAALERLADESERSIALQPPEQRERKRAEVALLRDRLRNGDFRAGDRIVLRVRADSTMTDTFVVRSGAVLELRSVPPISLQGVLRSELESHLTKEIARYFRDPHVEATSLIRIGVMGEVTAPGYFAMAADALVSDAIMLAGGPNSEADVNRITIRRGADDLLRSEDVRSAIVDGRTLDQLNMRAGDEIVVGERKRRSFGSTMSVISGLVAVAVGLVAVSR